MTFACAWHVCKHLQMLRVCKRQAQLHTFPCLCPSSLFLHTHVRVLKLETASTVTKLSSGGSRRLFSAHTGFSYWLCTSAKGDLPPCILCDSDGFGKSKVTLSSGFSTSITHSEPKLYCPDPSLRRHDCISMAEAPGWLCMQFCHACMDTFRKPE